MKVHIHKMGMSSAPCEQYETKYTPQKFWHNSQALVPKGGGSQR